MSWEAALATTLIVLTAPFVLLKLEGVAGASRVKKALSINEFSARSVVLAASMLTQLLFALIIIGFALNAFGLLDSEKVVGVIREGHWAVLLIAITLGPIAEELLFRGYLQRRIGIILSSLLFAGLHYGYGSVSEITGAFAASIILGYGMRKHGDLVACTLTHAAYNAFSIWLAFSFF
jgi:membrane protease YdiL (CAAX protease family)